MNSESFKTISIDVGTKNCGIYIVDSQLKPCYINNINLTPYSAKKLLTIFNDIFDNLDVKIDDKITVIIENQLKKNIKMTAVMHHIEMYFLVKYQKCDIILLSPKNKYIEKSLTYSQRKNKSVDIATEYFQKNYPEFYEKLMTFKKKDDISDAVCQLLFFNKMKIL